MSRAGLSLWASQDYVENRLLEEQRHADFDIKEYPVEVLVEKFERDDIVIPEYQREFVWDQQKQSRFIESILLGLPIPYMFAADIPKTGELEIVDGVQRLRTLKEFLQNRLVIGPLDKLGFLEGARYGDLPPSQQRRFRNRTLRMIVLSERSDEDIRFDIFDRINTGSVSLEPAEIRRGAFPGPFYDLVRECAEDAAFRAVCPLPPSKIARREGEELVLRFFAYADRYKAFDHDVAKFLNQYLRDQNAARPNLKAMREDFDAVIAFVAKHIPQGFAKKATARSVPRVRFEALAVGTHLALREHPKLSPADLSWLDSEEFRKHTTTDASNSGPKLRARIEYVRDRLLGGR